MSCVATNPAAASAVLDVQPKPRAGRLIPIMDELTSRIAGLEMDIGVMEISVARSSCAIAEARRSLEAAHNILEPKQYSLFG